MIGLCSLAEDATLERGRAALCPPSQPASFLTLNVSFLGKAPRTQTWELDLQTPAGLLSTSFERTFERDKHLAFRGHNIVISANDHQTRSLESELDNQLSDITRTIQALEA